MSDIVFSLVGKAIDVIGLIINRLHQLKLTEDIAARISEILDYLQITIKKIRPHLKQDSDTKEIKQFLALLENAYQSCAHISEKSFIAKFASAPSDISKLHNIEADIKEARCKLQLFIEINHLSIFCDFANDQNQMLGKLYAVQGNRIAGFTIVEDKSVRPPSAPHGLTIQEDKNELILSWEPSEGTVDEYEVCYDEHIDCTLPVGIATTVKLESPRVQPSKVYAMKVRGINKGGKGKWSDVVIGQITKPFPQKPEISNLVLQSTTAVITVKVAKAVCSTESPVTCIEVSYAITPSTQFTTCKFATQPENDTCTFTINSLQPNSNYNFRVKTQNAEGWSKPSDLSEGNTLSLPLPAKPNPPSIKIGSPTKVKLMAEVPENTSSNNLPIIGWRVHGYSESNEEIDKYYPHELDCMEACSTLNVVNLNSNQQYTLQLFAENENGWSEPSEEFKIHIAAPSPPENVRVSSKRTHFLIKIRWNAPASVVVAHYEVAKTTRKGSYDKNPIVVPGIKFSITFTKLNQKTTYYFKVRVCNGFYTSNWSNEIKAKTKIHKAVKAAFSPFVWAVGTVTAPLTMSLGGGVQAGKIVRESGGNKGGVAAAATGGAVGGAALGIVTAPVVGAAYAHMFVHGIDELSDQSDDEGAVIIEEI